MGGAIAHSLTDHQQARDGDGLIEVVDRIGDLAPCEQALLGFALGETLADELGIRRDDEHLAAMAVANRRVPGLVSFDTSDYEAAHLLRSRLGRIGLVGGP